jgi:hypothetical protein
MAAMVEHKEMLRWILPSGQANRTDLAKALAVIGAFVIPYSLVAYVPMPPWAMLALLGMCLVVLLGLAYLIWAGLVQTQRS